MEGVKEDLSSVKYKRETSLIIIIIFLGLLRQTLYIFVESSITLYPPFYRGTTQEVQMGSVFCLRFYTCQTRVRRKPPGHGGPLRLLGPVLRSGQLPEGTRKRGAGVTCRR